MVKPLHPPHPPHPAHPEAEVTGGDAEVGGVASAAHWSQEIGWHVVKIAPDASGRADESSVAECLRRFIRGGSDRGQLISIQRSGVQQLEGSSLLQWSGHPLDGDDALLHVAGIAVSGFTHNDAVQWITQRLFRQLPEDNSGVRIDTAPLKGKSIIESQPLTFANWVTAT